jgi:hypothetical protein
MGKAGEKRKKIFDRFSTHLSELKKEGKLESIDLKHDNTYICPICLNQFSNADLQIYSANMLTSEDSPPDCLGGKKVALTCKDCNNRCGHDLDFHLQEAILELDSRELLPHSTRKAAITVDGETVHGELRVTETSMEVSFSEKSNNPAVVKEHLKKIVPNKVATVEPKPSRVDPLKFEVALLKSAYILAFAKFGYNLFLDPCYDIVREQLKNPDRRIYPEGFWTKQRFVKEHEGVHFILDNGYQAIFVILPLVTKSTTRRFGVALPLPNVPIEEVVAKLKEQEAGFGLTLDNMGGGEVDYLTNKEAIEKMNDWISNLHN